MHVNILTAGTFDLVTLEIVGIIPDPASHISVLVAVDTTVPKLLAGQTFVMKTYQRSQ